MINDLKFKLQRECEKSESWRTKFLQKVQEKKEMIQASSGYKDTIVKLNEELSKCIRKNEKMLGYWTEFSKLEVQRVTQNYESTIQILKDDFAKEFTKAMEENNTFKEEVESLRLGLSIACRGIEKLKMCKLDMQEQISELIMEIEDSKEEIKTLYSERNNLIVCNIINKNENELQINKNSININKEGTKREKKIKKR